jgi:hypothetical protein
VDLHPVGNDRCLPRNGRTWRLVYRRPSLRQEAHRNSGRLTQGQRYGIPEPLRQCRNYCGLIKTVRRGFPWEKTTRLIASVNTNCETAPTQSRRGRQGTATFGRTKLDTSSLVLSEALSSPPKVEALGRSIYRDDKTTIWGRMLVATRSTISDKNERIGPQWERAAIAPSARVRTTFLGFGWIRSTNASGCAVVGRVDGIALENYASYVRDGSRGNAEQTRIEVKRGHTSKLDSRCARIQSPRII